MPLGHPWEWWFTEFLPALEGIGSLATLGLVILYYYLFRETQEQTHALQAAHTPVLDVRHNIGENDLLVSITNRGVGTATNVKLRIKITSDDQIYEYEGKLPSLRPGQTYQEDTDDISSSALRNPFKVAPTFDLGKETVCISELLDHLKKESTDNCWVQVYVEYTDVIEVLDGEEYLMAGFLDPTKEGFHKAFKLPELEAVENPLSTG